LWCRLPRGKGRERPEHAQTRVPALRLQAAGPLGDGGLGPPLCVVFEGWDASGPGAPSAGSPPRSTPAMCAWLNSPPPARGRRRHHFLWRCWSALPGWGGMSDRSWYGRVLVERVEEFATQAEWQRANEEVVLRADAVPGGHGDGEALAARVRTGAQRRRFRAREQDPLKRWKLTDEDWRNLARRAPYNQAVSEMLARTDHHEAPWRVIPAENQPYARALPCSTRSSRRSRRGCAASVTSRWSYPRRCRRGSATAPSERSERSLGLGGDQAT